MADDTEVQIKIVAKNLTAEAFGKANAELKKLGIEAELTGTKTSKGFLGASKAGDLLHSSFAKLTGAFSAASLIDRAVGAIASWTSEAIESAGTIVDLSNKTGLGTEAIQRMSHVAKLTGSSLEAFTGAAFKLGTTIAGGGGSVVRAVEKLGLSYESLRALKPEQQFDAVVAALERMTNPQERNRAAVDLFGKRAEEILPAVAEGYSTIAREAVVSSEAQLKAIDAAAEEWDKFVERQKTGIRSWLGDLVIANAEFKQLSIGQRLEYVRLVATGQDAMAFVLKLADARARAARASDVELKAEVDRTAQLRDEIKRLRDDAMVPLSAEQRLQIRQLKDLGVSTKEIAEKLDLKEAAVSRALEAEKRATDAAKKFTDANKDLRQEIEKLIPKVGGLNAEFANVGKVDAYSGAVFELATAFMGWKDQSAALEMLEAVNLATSRGVPIQRMAKAAQEQIHDTVEKGIEAYRRLGLVAPQAMRDIWMETRAAIPVVTGLGAEFANVGEQIDVAIPKIESKLGDFAGRLSQTIMGALQGGGGVGKSIGGFLGGSLFTEKLFGKGDLAKSLTTKITGWVSGLSGTLASALGAVLPALGTVLGSLGGELVGKLFGAFDRNKGRDVVQQFAQSFGGFDALHEKLGTLGAAGEQLWVRLTQGVGRNNPAEAKSAIDAITAALDEQQQKHAEATATHNSQLASLITAAQGAGETLPAELVPYIDKLREAKLLTDDNAAALRGLATNNGGTWQQMEADAKKFGIELSALGPTFQQQKLTATATEIIGVMDRMVKNGADFNGVLAGTKDEINDVVKDSLKFGTEIPGNMKPWIAKLIESKDLVDQNGKKITDINQLKFGEDVKVGLDDVVLKLQEMIDLMKDGLPGAVGTVGQHLRDNKSAWDDWKKHAKSAAEEVGAEVDGISFGHSPGGLKEIPLQLAQAMRAGSAFRDKFTDDMRRAGDVADLGFSSGRAVARAIAAARPARAVSPVVVVPPTGSGALPPGGQHSGPMVIENHITVALDGHVIDQRTERVVRKAVALNRIPFPRSAVKTSVSG